MSESWPVGTLSDLAEANPDRAAAVRGLERFRYIDISCLSESGIASADSIAVIEAQAAPSRAQRLVKTGDSLVGTVRPERGARGLVGAQLDGEVASSGICVLRPKLAEDAGFVYSVVRSPDFTEWCVNHSTGTSYPAVSASSIAKFPLSIPAREERQRIAEVLGVLDDRIESAARIEKVLGEAVLAEYGLALLDRAEEAVVSLANAVSLINGGAYTKGADGTGRMVIRIKELNSGPSESTVYSSITVPGNKTAFPGDVLFAWSGSLGVWRWYRDEAIVNQHIFKVLPKEHTVWLGWIHILGELERFQDIAAGKATTMGHITKDHLERTMVPTFSAEELEVLASRVEPLWGAQLQAGRELHALEAVRAQLLPALVSGELRVAEAEKVVEASV